MAFEINIHVNKNGRLESELFPLEISVFRESKRVKLLFEVDAEIDSTYHYLKFTHANATYLYRVHNNEFEIPKAITAYEGAWEMSFVACDEVANSDSTITANSCRKPTSASLPPMHVLEPTRSDRRRKGRTRPRRMLRRKRRMPARRQSRNLWRPANL